MRESRGGGSDRQTCSLPNGIRTGPVTNDVVANSRDQPNQRAHSTNAGTVTTTHGRFTRIARNVWAGLVPSTCEAAQPPRPLTKLRDMASNDYNADTLYILAVHEEAAQRLATLAESWGGEPHIYSQEETERALGTSRTNGCLVQMWWD